MSDKQPTIKKNLQSESIPEFQESINNMSQELKDKVDNSIKEAAQPSIEDVLENKERVFYSDSPYTKGTAITIEDVILAMSEWAEIKTAPLIKRISELEKEIKIFDEREVLWSNKVASLNDIIESLEKEIEKLKA